MHVGIDARMWNHSGIGVYLRTTDDGLLITAVREGYPAYEGGIRPGDLIVAIRGEPTPGMTQADLVGKLKGPVGTTVDVSVKTGEEPPRDVTLTRAIIRMESVLGIRLVDEEAGIGYIRIDSFRENTVQDFQDGLVKLKEMRARAIILDADGQSTLLMPCCDEDALPAPLEGIVQQIAEYLQQVAFIALELQAGLNIDIQLVLPVAVDLQQ